jgi:hypothetical protein
LQALIERSAGDNKNIKISFHRPSHVLDLWQLLQLGQESKESHEQVAVQWRPLSHNQLFTGQWRSSCDWIAVMPLNQYTVANMRSKCQEWFSTPSNVMNWQTSFNFHHNSTQFKL